nr:myosin-binding protein 2 [Ipomoea trifida]
MSLNEVKKTIELRGLSVDLNENAMSLNEAEEEKVPDTPSSVDSLHRLHRKLLLLEKKDSASEESLDGSVIRDLDGLDPFSAIERLKTALKSERKALHSVYTELEEERSASAVAANKTMAMINRLQEEKGAMQMEALQY